MSGAALQQACESRFAEFPDIVRCTRDAVAEKAPSKLDDPRVKLYLLRGEQLAADVREGKLRSIDAKVEWQRLFVQYRDANDAAVAAGLLAASTAMQVQQQPQPSTKTVCTSEPIFGQMRTECTSR